MTGTFADFQSSLGGTYTIERELGGGGMSRVFVAREHALGREVVMKVLTPEISSSLSAERFRREILLAATLQHPLIVPVLSAADAGELLYFTMPLVRGESLRARLERDGPLPVAVTLRILRDISSALAYAHARGVIHRDIKPDNILLSGEFALVADFGIARAVEAAAPEMRLTGTGITLGTPAYMAPEQIVADVALDARADIYSAGIVAYQMLTGRVPFAGTSAQAVLGSHLTRQPDPIGPQRSDVPAPVAALVLRCLAKEPGDRVQSAAELHAATEALLALDRSGERMPAARRVGVSRRALVAVGAGLCVAAGAWAWRATHPSSGDAAAREPAAIRSIAVLPFVNASADARNEYFSDGVTEELIDALAKLPALRVESRSSSFAFKGHTLGARAIGDSLHVQSVLEGSVRRDGTRLRITAQLTNVRDGATLWSQRFDREERDVFGVQEELAHAIIGQLQTRLGAGAIVGADGRDVHARYGTSDPEAYDLYLRGRHAWNERSLDGFRRAVVFFGGAIARDSGFARAWTGLADSYCIQSNFNHEPAREVCPRSVEAARRAIALDSTLAEAHASLGFVHLFYEWDLDAAERELIRASTLDSTLAEAHLWRMHVSWVRGDTAEMLRHVRRALRLEPLSPILNSRYTSALWRAGMLDSAIAQGRRTVALDPDFLDGHCYLSLALLAHGQLDEGVREMERYGRPLWEAYAYGIAGRRADAERILTDQVNRASREYVSPLLIARIQIALGRRDDAVRWLQRSLEAREPDDIFLDRDPQFGALAADPRFRDIVRRVRAPSR